MTSGPVRSPRDAFRVQVPVATWYTPAWRIGAVIGTRRERRLVCATAAAARSVVASVASIGSFMSASLAGLGPPQHVARLRRVEPREGVRARPGGVRVAIVRHVEAVLPRADRIPELRRALRDARAARP